MTTQTVRWAALMTISSGKSFEGWYRKGRANPHPSSLLLAAAIRRDVE